MPMQFLADLFDSVSDLCARQADGLFETIRDFSDPLLPVSLQFFTEGFDPALDLRPRKADGPVQSVTDLIDLFLEKIRHWNLLGGPRHGPVKCKPGPPVGSVGVGPPWIGLNGVRRTLQT